MVDAGDVDEGLVRDMAEVLTSVLRPVVRAAIDAEPGEESLGGGGWR
ncbi:hypothetical protein [Actinoplanes palleronii]